MNPIRSFFEKQRKHFEAGGALSKLEPFFESMEKYFSVVTR